ncbi:PPE domain-containing protein [Nocardia higoensis]|uniref:PPE domain-containing protein n=1 Tax=Nocardia higoensis TaxID=228599 RepID=A0ABS0D496_9NOCA|nr:PPE domain-containing protein [Nocardia higoensis]MBF6353310.1 PPE domain-containing protein [Nocardia higoensis]
MTFGKFLTELSQGGPGYLVDRVTGLFDDDISPTDSEQAAQTEGNDARDRLYAENSSLSQGFAGDFTNPVVPPVLETFIGMPHERIMSFIDSIGLSQMSESVQAWKNLATETSGSATTFHDNIAKEMERGWAGTAASSALATVRSYLGDVHRVDQALSLIANKMEEAYTGFQQVHYQVPHPSEARADGKIAQVVSTVGDTLLGNVSGMITGSDSRRAQDAEDKANEVMRTVYAPVVQQADQSVPKVPLPATPAPGSDKPVDVPGGTSLETGTPAGEPNSERPGSENPDTENPDTENPGSETPGDENSTDTDASDDTPGSDMDETNPSSTPPSGTDSPTSPAGTTPSSYLPSSGNPGSPGLGSPGTGTPGSPGSSIPGAGQSTTTTTTSAGTGTGSGTGRAGMTGMGGMGGGRGGNGKDDENEHGSPDYLRDVYEELLGPDRGYVPPVIGEQE